MVFKLLFTLGFTSAKTICKKYLNNWWKIKFRFPLHFQYISVISDSCLRTSVGIMELQWLKKTNVAYKELVITFCFLVMWIGTLSDLKNQLYIFILVFCVSVILKDSRKFFECLLIYASCIMCLQSVLQLTLFEHAPRLRGN